MSRESWLPSGGNNLFQGIKAKKEEARARGRGIELIDLSIGQPEGAALLSARRAAAEAVMSDAESMHEYQDNASPGVPDFARRFAQAHIDRSLEGIDVDFLPIPGIKPMLGLIPLACGDKLVRGTILTMTKPGYPTPRDWAVGYLGRKVHEAYLAKNDFRVVRSDFGPYDLLLMLNYPHNPSGQVATRDYWEELCALCDGEGIRIFNDAAYIALNRWHPAYAREHGHEVSCSLADVAIDFPNLSWVEGYSASKVIGNGTGWRIGALAGSPDFIGDIKTIKGNTDSGFAAPLAAGVLAAVEADKGGLARVASWYAARLNVLTSRLQETGMKLAVEPAAGFFTLWSVPTQAFGVAVSDAAHFNNLMIEQTGVVGVPFDPFIRYSVARSFDPEAVADAFAKAAVSYKSTIREGVVS